MVDQHDDAFAQAKSRAAARVQGMTNQQLRSLQSEYRRRCAVEGPKHGIVATLEAAARALGEIA